MIQNNDNDIKTMENAKMENVNVKYRYDVWG